MSARRAFVVASAALFAALLVLLVVRPAIERGGVGELALVAAAVAAILLAERVLRWRG